MGPLVDQSGIDLTGETSAGPARLPHGLALLCVSPREPSWAGLTLRLDALGCHEPTIRWVSSAADALTVLRDETFDCLVVESDETCKDWNAFSFLAAVRAGGHDDPAIVLAGPLEDERWQAAANLNCSVITVKSGWQSRALPALIAQEIERSDLRRDKNRLALADHRRLVRERDETEQLLKQQRQILEELHELIADHPRSNNEARETRSQEATESEPAPDVLTSPGVVQFYEELLRTYVMMGSGRLAEEIEQLARIFAAADVSPRQALGMHLKRVESLVNGLGRRSSRHVMARADILALELVIQLGERYRTGKTDFSRSRS